MACSAGVRRIFPVEASFRFFSRRRRVALACAALLLLCGLACGGWWCRRAVLRRSLWRPRLVSVRMPAGSPWETGMARMRVELPLNVETEIH